VSWQLFERAAVGYEAWYATPRGRRVDRAERSLLGTLLTSVPDARTVVDVGCGTGHFAAWLRRESFDVVGLDRSPAMLARMRQDHPSIPVVLGDAVRLPFRAGAVDATLLVTVLEFLEEPAAALAEAVRVARHGVVVLILNRWSVGGLSRRIGPQARGSLLASARDTTLLELRRGLRVAAGERLRAVRGASTLFPDGLWAVASRLPLGDVIGMAVTLSPPEHE
jgi:SAM-dependent methyltransferase